MVWRQLAWIRFAWLRSHIDPWCAGVDWLWDVDYQAMVTRGEIAISTDLTEVADKALKLADPSSRDSLGSGGSGRGDGVLTTGDGNVSSLLTLIDPPHRVLRLRGTRRGHQQKGRKADVPLGWLPLGGFRTLDWHAPLPRRVERALRSPPTAGGLGLSSAQVHIVKTCLKSLATSRE